MKKLIVVTAICAGAAVITLRPHTATALAAGQPAGQGVPRAVVTQTRVQQIQAPQGVVLPFTMVAVQDRQAPSRDLLVTLKANGTLEVDGVVLTMAPPKQATREPIFLLVDRLVLKKGACIVTNGNPLVIFTNWIDSEDGCIRSFLDKDAKGAPGTTGMPGEPGLNGGLVSIHVIHEIIGILHADLRGQDGGDGGGSNLTGAAGMNGLKGNAPSSGVFGCNQAGGNGTPGASGSIGGTGGDGGTGGSGGVLELFNVGPAPLPSTLFTFQAKAGVGGNPGAGGPGGPGGQGGPGGDGGGFCNGGQPGQAGAQGPAGPTGHAGASGNTEGTLVVKNLDMEYMTNGETLRLAERLQQQ